MRTRIFSLVALLISTSALADVTFQCKALDYSPYRHPEGPYNLQFDLTFLDKPQKINLGDNVKVWYRYARKLLDTKVRSGNSSVVLRSSKGEKSITHVLSNQLSVGAEGNDLSYYSIQLPIQRDDETRTRIRIEAHPIYQNFSIGIETGNLLWKLAETRVDPYKNKQIYLNVQDRFLSVECNREDAL